MKAGIEKGFFYKPCCNDMIRAWCAFSATDINNDNSVNSVELKYLLYAYEGDVCTDARIHDEMKYLDADESGEINRKEWLEYLCCDNQ